MANEHDQHENAVNQVLAALREAAPPPGMNERIVHHLAQQSRSAPKVDFRWHDLFANSSLAGAWWRGALSGAVTATFAIGLFFLFAGNLARTSMNRIDPSAKNTANVHQATPVKETTQNSAPSQTCSGPVLVQQNTAHEPHLEYLRADVSRRPYPAAGSGLTSQERELVRLVRTTDPKVLAALNSEPEAKAEAREEAEFDRFFAPSPAVATAENEPTANNE